MSVWVRFLIALFIAAFSGHAAALYRLDARGTTFNTPEAACASMQPFYKTYDVWSAPGYTFPEGDLRLPSWVSGSVSCAYQKSCLCTAAPEFLNQWAISAVEDTCQTPAVWSDAAQSCQSPSPATCPVGQSKNASGQCKAPLAFSDKDVLSIAVGSAITAAGIGLAAIGVAASVPLIAVTGAAALAAHGAVMAASGLASLIPSSAEDIVTASEPPMQISFRPADSSTSAPVEAGGGGEPSIQSDSEGRFIPSGGGVRTPENTQGWVKTDEGTTRYYGSDPAKPDILVSADGRRVVYHKNADGTGQRTEYVIERGPSGTTIDIAAPVPVLRPRDLEDGPGTANIPTSIPIDTQWVFPPGGGSPTVGNPVGPPTYDDGRSFSPGPGMSFSSPGGSGSGSSSGSGSGAGNCGGAGQVSCKVIMDTLGRSNQCGELFGVPFLCSTVEGPDTEFKSSVFDPLAAAEGAKSSYYAGILGGFVQKLGIPAGGNCSGASFEINIAGYRATASWVTFCEIWRPIVNWFFWALVLLVAVNEVSRITGRGEWTSGEGVITKV